MYRFFHYSLLCLLCLPATLTAQNVGIGTTNPHASAQLEVSSTTRGMLLPRMTTAQRDAIAVPAKGLLIYNLDDNSIDRYDGSRWQKENGLTALDSITAAGHPTPNSWVQRANAGTTPRNGAVAFTIGKKGYMGTGTNAGNHLNDFWSYDPLTNAWTQLADFGGAARWLGLGFAVADKGYIGTGRLQNGTRTDDFWEYNTATNQWAPKAAVPEGGRAEGVGFSLNGMGYAGLGITNSNDPYLYRYDPATNTWTALTAAFPGGFRNRATAFTLNGKAYIGLGQIGLNQVQSTIYPYDPATNSWGAAIATHVGLSGSGWRSFTLGNKAYVGMGNETNSFFAYDPVTNTWAIRAAYPGQGRGEGIALSFGNKGYMGTGSTGSSPVLDFWEYMDDNNKVPLASSLPAGTTGAVTDGTWTLDGGTVYKSSPGNVGIGTTNPATPLDVNGKIKATTLQLTTGAAAGRLLQSDAGGNASWVAPTSAFTETDPQVGTLSTDRVPKWNGTTLADGLITDNGSNVGIGTATPTHLLTVVSQGENTFADVQTLSVRSYSNTSSAWKGGAAFGYNQASVIMGQLINVATIGGHNATLGAWANLAINPGGGNVGIGTFDPDPLARLDVNGRVKATGLQMTTGAAAGRLLQSDANGNASWVANPGLTETDPEVGANTTSFLSKWNGTQLVASTLREDAGKVGINAATAANAALQVNSANPGTGNTNWITANMGSSGATADRLVMGTLSGKATIGGHSVNLSGWADLTLNPGGGNVGVRTASPAAGFDVQAPSIRLGVNGDNFKNVQTFEVTIPELALGVNGSGTFAFNPAPQNGVVNSKSAVFVNSWGLLPSGVVIAYCWAVDGNNINIRFQNTIAEARTIPAGTYRVTAINFE